MPVIAKLSRKFYETFGDELTSELVDWFNSVDASYRAEFRDLFEVHFARFDAKLEQRVAEVKAELRQEIAQLRVEFHRELGSVKADLIKWTFLFWAPTALAVIGLYFKR